MWHTSFVCNISFWSKNFYRNESVPFSFLNFTSISDTENLKPDEKKLLASQNASFISYSPEFTLLIGFNPQLTLIKQWKSSIQFAHEGGAYIPETDEVWFTANQLPVQNKNISSINLITNQINLLDIHPPIITPNGVNYFEGVKVRVRVKVNYLHQRSWYIKLLFFLAQSMLNR